MTNNFFAGHIEQGNGDMQSVHVYDDSTEVWLEVSTYPLPAELYELTADEAETLGNLLIKAAEHARMAKP